MVALALVGALGAEVRADDECKALDMREPKDADFEKCLKKRPLLEVGLIGSLTLGGVDGFQPSLYGVADIPLTRPVYLSVRTRLGGDWQELDLLAGYVLGYQYGAGNYSFISQSNTYHSPSAYGYSYTTTTRASTSYVVQRSAWVLMAGVKGTRRGTPEGTMDAPELDKFKTLQFGIARHYANHGGLHTRIELIAMKRGEKWGGAVRWFNAIVGMEVGIQPMLDVSSDGTEYDMSVFYWNFIELGRFWDI
ncbi:MAG: hypothetical protein SFX73_19910 [Kofleriaceae bacterium]|nr:hypothetical protein [Kofleriaceae bacterium]